MSMAHSNNITLIAVTPLEQTLRIVNFTDETLFEATMSLSSNQSNFSAIVYPPSCFDYDARKLNTSQRYIIAGVSTFFMLLSIVLNSAALFTHLKRKIRQNSFFRTCLMSLAFSDILTTVFVYMTYISYLVNEFQNVWALGSILCSVVPFVTTTAILVNSLTLVGIALQRYWSVKVFRVKWNPNPWFCISWAILVWGFAAGVASPMLSAYWLDDMVIILTDPDKKLIGIGILNTVTCISNKDSNKYYFSAVFSIIFVPLVIMFIWLNIVIAKEIWRRRRPIRSNSKIQMRSLQISIFKSKQMSLSKKTKDTLASNVVDNIEQDASITTNTSVPSPSPPCTEIIENRTETRCADNVIRKTNTTTERETRQQRMFGAILFLLNTFLICRLPTWTFQIYRLYSSAKTNTAWVLYYVFGLLSLLNCILNPLLYTFLTEIIQLLVKCVNFLRHRLNCFKR